MTAATKTLALVGAGPGLGFSIAKRFGAAGFQVALLARNADKLDQLVAELDSLGVTARGYVADALDRPGLASALAQVEADFGAIDVLEYSPSAGGSAVPAAETTPEDVLASFEPQVLGAVATVNAVLQGMRARKDGTLLFTTGASSVHPIAMMGNARCRRQLNPRTPKEPHNMKAITLNEPGTAPAARNDLPTPTPGAGEVLVRVQASSVNPVDNSIAAGMLAQMGVEHEYPVTLGRDYAGMVEQVGADVTDYAPGDEVFGFLLHANPSVREGSWSEFITVSADASIARRPTNVDVAAAGAAALAGITAVTAIDALDITEGDTVLIVGATGGVGSLAVQLAAQAGATIVAPALPEDEQYLRDLGVTELVPREGDVAAAVSERFPDGVDALLDLINYTPGTYDAALKDAARVASPTGAAGEGPGRAMVMAQPSTANLDRVAQLLDSGTLKVPVQDIYELDRAADALQALASNHTQGKLAIRVS